MSSFLQFAFGQNWQSYARYALTDQKIENARHSFQVLFEGIPLRGASFLDIGFGQGLTLCLAHEMGASALGIDNDPENLAALAITARKFGLAEPPETRIVSILDPDFVQTSCDRGGFDIVHAWGVLHHTGDLNRALRHAARLVKPNGTLILAIYNKHWSSPIWWQIKRLYNWMPSGGQRLLVRIFYPFIYVAKALVTRKNPARKARGMDFGYDVIDWLGGFPYEYATPAEIRTLLVDLGLRCLRTLPAAVPTGCNQFVCKKML